jgi:hypothetical protein
MTKTAFFRLLLLFFVTSSAYGQKVKYKDIFALLSTKQYEQAEPFLKRYLIENDDNPNAFLYRGFIFQERSMKSDVLKQTSLVLAQTDSAILFYDKALKSIDEREVRKNKEYYQVYNRRDLRTGEFGVKLSDIQFDVEKRIQALRERGDKVKMLKHYFSLSDSLYKKSNALFVSIQKRFPTEKYLYLRADDALVKDLKTLSERFDSCRTAFDSYLTSASNLGNTGYNHALSIKEISDYGKDGIERADFFKDEITLWDYKKFADKVHGSIVKEIIPMREHLITYDIEINKLRDKLNTDSVSVKNDLTKLVDQLLHEKLQKFDSDPLPIEVFVMKTSDLEYRSTLLDHKTFRDSADLHFRLSLLQKEMKALNKLDSVCRQIEEHEIDERSKDYEHFITNTYSSPVVLKSYVNALKDYTAREKEKKEAQKSSWTKSLEWIVDGIDSIPVRTAVDRIRYKPLGLVEEKYTIGIHLIDTANAVGYFYTLIPSRKPDIKSIFPLDKNLREKNLAHLKSASYSDANGTLFFAMIASDKAVNGKFPATLAKIYRTDGLAWTVNYELPFVPKELNLRVDTGELTIKNETQQIVVDKNGKVLR